MTTEATEVVDETRYRFLDHTAYYAGNDFQVIEAHVTGARQVLPAITEPLLAACDRFRTLSEHARIICQSDPFRDVPPEALGDLLAGLTAADLLVSHEALAERCRVGTGQHHRATIATVGIPTYNRPGALHRVVRSVIENATRHSRTVEIVVADDSDAEHQTQNLAVLDTLRAEHGIAIWYAGAAEKAAYARDLAAHCNLPEAVVRVALTHPTGWPGAPGANRNALLLHAVGEAFLTLDDDMVCEVARLPESDDRLALTSTYDPTEWWFYADPAETRRTATFVVEDFLGWHESLLGMNVGRVATEQAAGAPLDLDSLGNDFLRNLEPDGGAVTFTMAGVLGDSGLQESLPFFFADGATLQRLLHATGGHRGAMASRQMARGVLRTTISDTPFCMGANIGIDNRRLLPPFQTAARNEDGAFAQMVRATVPGSFIGFLPRTVVHDPVRQRVFPVEQFDATVGVFEGAEAILRMIREWPTPHGRSTPRQRMISLGSYLTDLGRIPATEFERYLRDLWISWCAAEASHIERCMRRDAVQGPPVWVSDLRRYFDALVARLEARPPITLRELAELPEADGRAVLQAYLRAFGGLLQVWPDLVEGASELRARGRRLGRHLGQERPASPETGR